MTYIASVPSDAAPTAPANAASIPPLCTSRAVIVVTPLTLGILVFRQGAHKSVKAYLGDILTLDAHVGFQDTSHGREIGRPTLVQAPHVVAGVEVDYSKSLASGPGIGVAASQVTAPAPPRINETYDGWGSNTAARVDSIRRMFSSMSVW